MQHILHFLSSTNRERTQLNNISQCKSVHLCVQFTASLQHQEESETRMNAYLNHVGWITTDLHRMTSLPSKVKCNICLYKCIIDTFFSIPFWNQLDPEVKCCIYKHLHIGDTTFLHGIASIICFLLQISPTVKCSYMCLWWTKQIQHFCLE